MPGRIRDGYRKRSPVHYAVSEGAVRNPGGDQVSEDSGGGKFAQMRSTTEHDVCESH